MGVEMRDKIVFTSIFLIIALAITGVAYSHWQEKIWVTGTIITGKWSNTIGSSKVLTPIGYDENRSIESTIINGGKTLRLVCANISSGWNIWVGLIIHNDGTVPTRVEQPTIEIVGADIQEFTINTYFYGPYSRGDHTEVWGGVKIDDLPFNGWKGAGEVILEPCQKSVIWMEIKYEGEQNVTEATTYITIKYSIP